MKFSDKEANSLLSNKYVSSVSSSQVQFTPEFKQKALELHSKGLSPRDIFLKLGIEPDYFRDEYPKKCISRWKKISKDQGNAGLQEERRGKKSTGRPKKPVLKDEKSLRARIAMLEAEVEFLKKLRALEDEGF